MPKSKKIASAPLICKFFKIVSIFEKSPLTSAYLPRVENVQSHSPADESGVIRGDKLAAIWARLTGYMSLKEVTDALLDKPSLELKCTIERTINIPINPYRIIALGENELIGATFVMEFDGLTIASIRDGGASKEAGLKKGDLVIAIDGKPTRYMPLKNAVSMIKNSRRCWPHRDSRSTW